MNAFALIHDAAVLTLLGLWFGSATWVYTDARRRCTAGARPTHLLAAALALPFAVPLVYACLRPGESVAERRERELTRRLLEQALDAGERCLRCRTPLEPDFLCCPACGEEVRRRCVECRAPLRLHWSACPHCAHEPAATRLTLVA